VPDKSNLLKTSATGGAVAATTVCPLSNWMAEALYAVSEVRNISPTLMGTVPLKVMLESLDDVMSDNVALSRTLTLGNSVAVPKGGVMVTATDRLTLPPAPVHCRLNVVSVVSAAEVSDPEDGFAPPQPPEAAHSVAFSDAQSRLTVPPE
jgi:hypothetical protein